MRFVLERLSDPDLEPVTLAEMKRYLRMHDDDNSEDDDLDQIIQASREWFEDFTARALVDQRWQITIGESVSIDTVQQTMSCKCGNTAAGAEIDLRRSPILELVSVATVDAAGDETELEVADYQVREPLSRRPRLATLNGGTFPPGTTYRIVFRAGYANREDSPQQGLEVVPARAKQAIKLYAKSLDPTLDAKNVETYLKTAERVATPERCILDLT